MTITLDRPVRENPNIAPPAAAQPSPQTTSPAGRGPAGPSSSRRWLISPGAVAASWLAVVIAVLAIGPEPSDPAVRPTLLLTILAEIGALAFFGVLILGMLRQSRAASLGLFTGGVLLVGHLICGMEGHVPMTGWVWPTQLMLVAGVTALSGLAMATGPKRRS